ncbi:MAG: cyclic nucleotide-binding domain-containing protein [bacterium]|nr:cyclic nucleotide-binding domain-containing protein [bacterium]
MKVFGGLHVLFNIEQGTGKLVKSFFIHAFLIGVIKVFVRTSGYTLFLLHFDITDLPLVYIASAAVGTLFTVLYLQLQPRLKFFSLLSTILVFIFTSLLLFIVGFHCIGAKWLFFMLPVWSEVIINLTNIETGSLNSVYFSVREGKSLFGLIMAGEFLADIICGTAMGSIVNLIGTTNLLLISMMGVIGTFIVVKHISTSFSPKQAPPEKPAKISFMKMIKKKYILYLFICYIFFIVVYYLVDNAFYDQVHSRFHRDTDIAAFLGRFTAVYGIISLFILTFISGKILNRYGLLTGWLMLPIGISISAIFVVITGFFNISTVLLFWFIILAQLMRYILNYPFNRPSRAIFYQVLPEDERLWTQAATFGILDPVFSGISGVLLWFLMNILAFKSLDIFYVLIFILIGWFIFKLLSYKEYNGMLSQALSKRRLDKVSLNLRDKSSLSIIRNKLDSSHPAEIVHSLRLLLKIGYEDLGDTLLSLLNHPSPDVRFEVLFLLREINMESSVDKIWELFEKENSSKIRGEALHTIAYLSEHDVVENVLPIFEDFDEEVAMGAIVGLMESGKLEGVLVAGEILLFMVKSNNVSERIFASRVFGKLGVFNFYKSLLVLLQDDDMCVRKSALKSSSKIKNPRLIPLILQNLVTHELRSYATFALISMGEKALPLLESRFKQNEHDPEIQKQIIYIIGRINGEPAIEILKKQVFYEDKEIRFAILKALSVCAYQTKNNRDTIINLIKKIVEDTTWLYACISDLSQQMAFITRTLDHEIDKNKEMILFLLSFIYQSSSILQIKEYLNVKHTRHGEKKVYALELLDNIISLELKDLVFPIIEDTDVTMRIKRLNCFFPQSRKTKKERLLEMIQGEKTTSWTKSCVLFHVGRRGYTIHSKYNTILDSLLQSAYPLLRETAVWLLMDINPGRYTQTVQQLLTTDAVNVRNMAEYKLNSGNKNQKNEEAIMLTTVEKVIILRTVNIFSSIPDDDLASIAVSVKEIVIKAGECIMKKGDYRSSLYIILSGKVQVLDDTEEHPGVILEDRDLFGELSALDPGPSPETIIALEDTFLFSIDRKTIYEIMAEHEDVTFGIIHMLCRRIRSHSGIESQERQYD